jgi:LEA14-like dessication related protein
MFKKYIEAMCFATILALICISCRRPKELVYQDVRNFRLQHAGFQGAKVAFDVRLYNPNNLKVKLKTADIDVFMNDRHLGKVFTKAAFMIDKRDTFLLPVVLDVDMENVLTNTLQLLTNSEIDLKVKGTVRAGRHCVFISIPVNYEGTQSIR